MKKLVALLVASLFSLQALIAEAATPRAAEDWNAPVATTTAKAPKVKHKLYKKKLKKTKRAANGKAHAHKVRSHKHR
ncbi:MAG: hypothetical protein RIR00_1996 [Pseudomonadota bacterium]|jgi:hypothetical protein